MTAAAQRTEDWGSGAGRAVVGVASGELRAIHDDLRAVLIELLRVLDRQGETVRGGARPELARASALAERLVEVADRLHAQLAPTAPQLSVVPQTVDVHAALRAAVDEARATARERGGDVRLVIDESVPQRAMLDHTRFAHALARVLAVATAFLRGGDVSVQVIARGREGRADRLYVDVVDQGCGFDEASLQALFGLSGGGHAAVLGPGTAGLSLVEVARFVDACGGRIGVESAPGRGTRVWFSLAVELPASATPHESAGDEPAFAAGTRVLLVEDQPVNQKVAQRMLQQLGVDVDIAENGRIGVEMGRVARYDAVLMDLQMPVMDGFEATAILRAEHGPRLPILALTANTSEDDRRRCAEVGIDEVIGKPVRRPELQAALTRWLRRAA
jgi:CheY-like chemotaxis protein